MWIFNSTAVTDSLYSNPLIQSVSSPSISSLILHHGNAKSKRKQPLKIGSAKYEIVSTESTDDVVTELIVINNGSNTIDYLSGADILSRLHQLFSHCSYFLLLFCLRHFLWQFGDESIFRNRRYNVPTWSCYHRHWCHLLFITESVWWWFDPAISDYHQNTNCSGRLVRYSFRTTAPLHSMWLHRINGFVEYRFILILFPFLSSFP